MKQIVIISGKGGTGKTFLTAALAAIADNKVLADCDVDAANLHLMLSASVIKEEEYIGSRLAVIDRDKCRQCLKCYQACRFKAISEKPEIDSFSCEGCGCCALVCPEKAIAMNDEVSGIIYTSRTEYGPFIHARLKPGGESSGKLVARVREIARARAEQEKHDHILIDGSPGIGCPVIASLTGADYALVVVEPTLSGIHDMERVMAVVAHFKVSAGVVINKSDINPDNSRKIREWCRQRKLDLLAEIPFSKKVVDSVVQACPYPQLYKDRISDIIGSIWEKIK